MTGEKNLNTLVKNMQPLLNNGDYVFCTVGNNFRFNMADAVCVFKEKEGLTLILEKSAADSLGLNYIFVAAWITLSVHSSLEATGLTAAFSGSLANAGISCNVVAAYYHDHIFVARQDAERAMEVLKRLAESQ